jgi:predicted RNA polymerase sigma factor
MAFACSGVRRIELALAVAMQDGPGARLALMDAINREGEVADHR